MYAEGSFDCVIDKGTLDSILCGYDSGPNAELMVNEIYNVLSDKGVFICVSYGTKDMRLSYLQQKNMEWKVNVYQVAKQTLNTSDVVIAENKDD